MDAIITANGWISSVPYDPLRPYGVDFTDWVSAPALGGNIMVTVMLVLTAAAAACLIAGFRQKNSRRRARRTLNERVWKKSAVRISARRFLRHVFSSALARMLRQAKTPRRVMRMFTPESISSAVHSGMTMEAKIAAAMPGMAMMISTRK